MEEAIQEEATQIYSDRCNFDGVFREKYGEMLIEWMARGNSFRSFAGFIAVPYSTLLSWEEHHPLFAQAKEIGEAMEYGYLEKLMKLYAEGQIQGNATILKYLVSNRLEEYSEKPGEENHGNVIYHFEGLQRNAELDSSDLAEVRYNQEAGSEGESDTGESEASDEDLL